MHGKCVLSWTNERLIGMLAWLPLCSKFNNAVYASAALQSILLAQLSAADSKAIVFSSPNLAQVIDGRSMEKRLPEVHRYIFYDYFVQIHVRPYVIRAKIAETFKRTLIKN